MKHFAHQLKEYEEHGVDEYRALLWQQRTGKSRAIIDVACGLYQACAINAVIVIAPNGVHRNWQLEQLPQWHWSDVPYQTHCWRMSDDNNEFDFQYLLDCVSSEPLTWLFVNMESLHYDDTKKAIGKFIQRWPRFMLVLDESHHFGQPGSKRTAVVRGLAKQASYRRILTGTPMEDSPLQFYAQTQILKEGVLGFTRYDDYKDRYAEYKKSHGRAYDVLDRYINLDELRDKLAPFSSVVLRKDCADLPPVMITRRTIELGQEARELYNGLKKQRIDVLDALGFKKPPSGGALLTKLHQIEGGALITPKGVYSIDSEHAKEDAILEECCGGSRFIVLATYLHELERIAMRLRHRNIKCSVIHGAIKDRSEILKSFERGEIAGIVAQSHCVAEGYNISSAEKIIWASQTHTARIRAQANERATLMGGTSKQVVDCIVPGGVDDYYNKLCRTKTELADDIGRRGLQQIIEERNI